MTEINVRSEIQEASVASEVAALIAVVRPILKGLLYSLKADVVSEIGSHSDIRLKMLPRLYRPGDGDCGVCYEYAVHDAMRRKESSVLERVEDSLKKCKVPGNELESLLFGVEKNGATQLIATAEEILTDDSRLLTGKRSQPPKLKGYLNQLAAAFSRPTSRLSLPSSINGLWKADLFLGSTDGDRWVGTTVKINPSQLEAANGLRVGIVPAAQGKTDRVRKDDRKNLIICPIPYDGAFMEIFYSAWGIVQQFIQADAQLPKEVALPQGAHRQVARELSSRRDHPVVEVIEALVPISQPGLLRSEESEQGFHPLRQKELLLEGLISPIPKTVS